MVDRISRLECIVSQLGFIARSYWGLVTRNPIYLALADRKFAPNRAETRYQEYLIAEAGLEPESFHTEINRMKIELANSHVNKSVNISDIPKDLALLLRKWDKLPKSVKKTILSLVKHSVKPVKQK